MLGRELKDGAALGVLLGRALSLGEELRLGSTLSLGVSLGSELSSITQSLAHAVPQQLVGFAQS